jgi:hypothetical protein
MSDSLPLLVSSTSVFSSAPLAGVVHFQLLIVHRPSHRLLRSSNPTPNLQSALDSTPQAIRCILSLDVGVVCV